MIILWNEALMSHRQQIESLDKTLQDLMGNNLPFGGKAVVLGGHSAQLPPVIKKASRSQIVEASLRKSYLWRHFNGMRLHENMRIQNNGNDPEQISFDNWLYQLGEGKIPYIKEGTDIIRLPENMCEEIVEDSTITKEKAIHFVFGDIRLQAAKDDWTEFVSNRAILAPRNDEVDGLNNACLEKLPGEEVVCSSIDSTIDINDMTRYPVEYINTLNPSGMPPHKLRLKQGAVVMLLRNLNIKSGLCNGTRLIIEQIIHGRLLQCTIASGQHRGNRVLIPKIMMNPTDEYQAGFEWKRLQFPVRLSFAMTINKSQG